MHGTTFGGSPLSCRVGLAVLKRLDDKFLEMVSEKGKYLVSLLQAIKSPLITDIRGSGLMVGMDLAIDPAEFVERCRDYNLLVITAGTKTIRIVPPLTITFEELKSGVDIMTRVLKEMSSKARL